jgi:LmbE family N-acetylglucosaminyl deacetylase
MSEQPLRLLILGAHPDDAEFQAGGLAAIYRMLGHAVRIVSVTNGAAGHHEHTPSELLGIRRAEAAAAGRVIGASYLTWDNPDGHLQPTLDVRHQIVREIRLWKPDLVLTHRTCDYHPDHRAVGQAVQDASFMVTVPLVMPEIAALKRDPVVAYMSDLFTKPSALEPHVIIDITPYVDTIVAMLACHRSQVFEWLPYHEGILDQVPSDEQQRMAWLREWFLQRPSKIADRFRDAIIATYGHQPGRQIPFAEAYEISEYASPLDEPARRRLFAFLPEAN